MKHLQMTKCLMAALAAAACGTAAAAPITFNGKTYDFTASETLTALFNVAAGASTVSNYSGYVLVTVSGQGSGANGSILNDAFGYTGPAASPQQECGSLGVRTLALLGGCRNYAHDAIVYDVDQDVFVSAGGGRFVASYRADHVYSYVLSVDKLLTAQGQTTPQKLFFGTTDNNYGDNSGSFSVQVAQLNVATVPEPGSLALVSLAVLLAASGRRAGTRKAR